MTLSLGDALEGKYEILEKIGEGGMGSVYKVRHRLLEEVRVIKVLRSHAAEMEDLQRRFLREARMAIKLKHPNIAQLHDFSIAADGTAFIVMEFIDGIGLDAMIKSSEPPSVDLSVELSLQALAALHYLHEHQFVHRDVSPDNVMLTSNFDGTPLMKLIDLGIAKNLNAEAELTQTGVFLGKVRYCSPEQFSGKQGEDQMLDRGSDIYSYGVVLYELLTGVYPFNGESFAELAGSHLFQPPKDFEETDPDGRIPKELRQVVLKALEKDRSDRFETAADFAVELAAFRNPATPLKDEFDRTVEITTSTLSSLGDYTKSGSTQGRLNREFGLETTQRPLAPTGVRAGSGQREGQTLFTPARLAAMVGIPILAIAGFFTWTMLSGPNAENQAADTAPGSSSTVTTLTFEPNPRWEPTFPPSSDLDPQALDAATASLDSEPDLVQEKQNLDAAAAESEDAAEAGVEPAREEESPATETQVAEPTLPPSTQASSDPRIPPPDEAKTYQRGVGVIPPVLMELPEPTVPAGVRPPKEDTEFVVRVLVDERGSVLTAEIESGPLFKRRLRDEAVAAAKKAKYRPAIKGDLTGRMWTEIRIVFPGE